jgi:hypothetical protein
VREGARGRLRLGVAAVTVVWAGRPLVAIVGKGDERTRRGTVDDRKPTLGHLAG